MANFNVILAIFLTFWYAVNSQDDKVKCPGMIVSVNPKEPCYKIVTIPANYSSALAKCMIWGGQLVTSKNGFINDFIWSKRLG